MEQYAVIETGGKQYRVVAGSVLDVERLETEAGKEVVIDKILALSDGSNLTVGSPVLPGARLTAKVVKHYRGTKVISFKKRRRKGYERKQGHRQELTRIEIVDLGLGSPKASEKVSAE
jgi:large subunit ribosomal protein L21